MRQLFANANILQHMLMAKDIAALKRPVSSASVLRDFAAWIAGADIQTAVEHATTFCRFEEEVRLPAQDLV